MSGSALLAIILVLLLFTEPAADALTRWAAPRLQGPAARAATLRALGILVLVALVLVLDPEVRVFLVFVDSIGVDIFLLLLFFQGKALLQWLDVLLRFLAHRLETRGWFPMPLPNRALFKHHPGWSIYAAAQSGVIVFVVAAPLVWFLRILRSYLA